ncbi:hypothetical protein THASP1DRAFT_27724 [Thamnocephalis sphaerospora]|uniref:Uncharacterized protein n=1 Tax=Thamnocephalis sphaerospora TaxID=78915 RepID=A0A4P9XW15_9FUNG|nr:hypothetical protein THASP1DRAFT_27724 [Thamnocephalis sphaerospora]|eukprot:RKP10486.1 hypothetical protein THASP1DRAFT_27724 [Thamnocephalis sphaerospora]
MPKAQTGADPPDISTEWWKTPDASQSVTERSGEPSMPSLQPRQYLRNSNPPTASGLQTAESSAQPSVGTEWWENASTEHEPAIRSNMPMQTRLPGINEESSQTVRNESYAMPQSERLEPWSGWNEPLVGGGYGSGVAIGEPQTVVHRTVRTTTTRTRRHEDSAPAPEAPPAYAESNALQVRDRGELQRREQTSEHAYSVTQPGVQFRTGTWCPACETAVNPIVVRYPGKASLPQRIWKGTVAAVYGAAALVAWGAQAAYDATPMRRRRRRRDRTVEVGRHR